MLYFFALAVKFYKSSLLGCPPVLHHAPVRTFCVSFWSVTYIFLTKTGLLDAPQGGCPGSSHRPHPLCTPLHGKKEKKQPRILKRLGLQFDQSWNCATPRVFIDNLGLDLHAKLLPRLVVWKPNTIAYERYFKQVSPCFETQPADLTL